MTKPKITQIIPNMKAESGGPVNVLLSYKSILDRIGIDNDVIQTDKVAFLNLKQFVKKHKIPARIDFEISHSLKNWDKYEEIWETYLKKKNFPPTFKLTDLFEINPESKMVIELSDYDELVAFSVIRMDPGPVSLQFAWTYHEPKLSLGTHCQYFELYYLSGCGFHYNYVCPGYERTCIWKSRFPGFEFWTGSKWSRDKKVYTDLCITDSEIKDVDDLDKVGDLPLEMSSNKYMEWS